VSVVLAEDGVAKKPDALVTTWKERIAAAREDRARYEPTWMSNLAFAAGKHTLVYDRFRRQLVTDDEWEDRECYGADVITEQRAAALGELESDDDRPELLLVSDGQNAEALQRHINKAVGYGWEHEWDADEALKAARRLVLDMGVSAIRCRFDPTKGPVKQDNVPTVNGKPVLDLGEASKLFENGPNPDVQMRQIHDGRTTFEPLSALNLLTPPGINHERFFPWLVVVRPYPVSKVVEEFGDPANGLTEDGDIGSLLGMSAQDARGDQPSSNAGGGARLRGHVWLYTCYEMPNREHPNGQVVHLASNQMRLLRVDNELPYKSCDGEYRTGIAFFHWWRLNDRFWSRAFIEGLKDPQRVINLLSTLQIEITERALPFVLVPKGSESMERDGSPVEVIPIDWDAQGGQPILSQGMGPGDWMEKLKQSAMQDLSHASTLSSLRLGENPENVGTYSQLALLNENEQVKRQHILNEHNLSRARLIEDAVYDMRRYWGTDKQIMIAGEEGQIERQAFDASKIPDFYVVRVPKGTAKPRSQAAELKKVEDIAQYSINASTPLSAQWFAASLQAGEALDLPEIPSDAHAEKAAIENQFMFQSKEPPVAYYDPALTHIPIHREAQVRAELSGDLDTWQRIEQHVQEHLQVAQQNVAANTGTGPLPGGAQAPAPSTGPPAPQPQDAAPQPAPPMQPPAG
jgi:hypothetical protein